MEGRGRGKYFTTAILTGAVVLAWYIFWSAILTSSQLALPNFQFLESFQTSNKS
jgi:hypothetical protein